MNNVYLSARDAFYGKVKETKRSSEKMWAIWGTADLNQSIITTNGKGQRPNCSGELIKEGKEYEMYVGAYGGENVGRSYSINTGISVEKALQSATKDEIYLFLNMASPKYLDDVDVQKVIVERMEQLYAEELKQSGNDKNVAAEQLDEKMAVIELFSLCKDAIEDKRAHAYFPKGYQPDEYGM